jgi:serine/threonine protein kinase
VESLEDAKVKVCDFGLSTITKNKNDNEMTKNTFGSPAYAAPELPTPQHTSKVDVFSFAVM